MWGLVTGSTAPGSEPVVYVLLAGGNKSTQKKDIKRALELVRGLPKGE
jgi:putative component of toxin-antitoxin plasmid stabilization module